MDKRKMALIAAGVVGAGSVAVSLAMLVIGASGATLPVIGASYSCCCCCGSSYYVPLAGLVGAVVAAKAL